MLNKSYSNLIYECGTDEAGRGCLAGPVTAAAVILPEDFELALLNDSKKLTEKIRFQLRPIIEEYAISHSYTHIHNEEMVPLPFHLAQNIIWDSERRSIAMSAGSQSGKTSYGPWWLMREIYEKRGSGDYLAVTSSYDLFKLKMLPSMLAVFEKFGLGRYWAGDRVIELADPITGKFLANKSLS